MTSLIQAEPKKFEIVISAEALALRDEALALAGIIGRVSCVEEQQSAVDAQKKLVEYRRLVEESRVLCKKPALDFGRAVDAKAKELTDGTAAEELRLARLCGDFQALEMAKVKAARAIEMEKLAELEREKQRALAEAKTIEQVDAIQQDFNERTAVVNPPVVAPRAQGQVVKEVWEFEVVDPMALAKSHPNCVRIEVLRGEVKALLDSGIRPVGIKAWRETKAGVRV